MGFQHSKTSNDSIVYTWKLWDWEDWEDWVDFVWVCQSKMSLQ